jgi:hypothetical protein
MDGQEIGYPEVYGEACRPDNTEFDKLANTRSLQEIIPAIPGLIRGDFGVNHVDSFAVG